MLKRVLKLAKLRAGGTGYPENWEGRQIWPGGRLGLSQAETRSLLRSHYQRVKLQWMNKSKRWEQAQSFAYLRVIVHGFPMSKLH